MTNAHSKLLKQILSETELTQEQLATKTGIDQPTISRVLNGKRALTIQSIGKLLSSGMSFQKLEEFFQTIAAEVKS